MASFLFHIISAASLFSFGLYHLLLCIRSYLKSSAAHSARPCYPFPFVNPPSSRLRFIPLYLLLLALLISASHQLLLSSFSDPLVLGGTPVHRLNSLQSAGVIILFFLLALSVLLSEITHFLPLPHDVAFALLSAAFALHCHTSSSISTVQTSELDAKCDSVLALISAFSSLLSFALASNLKLFIAEIALAGSICLQGLWVLQTGLTLCVEAFIPEGCHRLLDVVSGVEGSTKCDLEDSRVRAVALLDLVFVFHVIFVGVIAMVAYAVTVRAMGIRRVGSYEALPASAGDLNHVQMKALTGTQA